MSNISQTECSNTENASNQEINNKKLWTTEENGENSENPSVSDEENNVLNITTEEEHRPQLVVDLNIPLQNNNEESSEGVVNYGFDFRSNDECATNFNDIKSSNKDKYSNESSNHHYIASLLNKPVSKVLNTSCETEITIPDDDNSLVNCNRSKNKVMKDYPSAEKIPLEEVHTTIVPIINSNCEKALEAQREYDSSTQNGGNDITHVSRPPINEKLNQHNNGTGKTFEEYFMPANTHKKLLRGEKLYLTKEKEATCNGWKLVIICGIILLVLIGVLLGILAAVGVFVEKEIQPSSIPGSSLPDSASISADINHSSKLPPNNLLETVMTEVPSLQKVPKPLVGELTLMNADFHNDLGNNNSMQYLILAEEMKNKLSNIFKSIGMNFSSVEILNFRPGSIIVRFKVTFKGFDVSSNITGIVQNFIQQENGRIGSYNVNISSIFLKEISNSCMLDNGNCSHYCEWNQNNYSLICHCPNNFLLSEDKRTCLRKFVGSTNDLITEKITTSEVLFTHSSELLVTKTTMMPKPGTSWMINLSQFTTTGNISNMEDTITFTNEFLGKTLPDEVTDQTTYRNQIMSNSSEITMHTTITPKEKDAMENDNITFITHLDEEGKTTEYNDLNTVFTDTPITLKTTNSVDESTVEDVSDFNSIKDITTIENDEENSTTETSTDFYHQLGSSGKTTEQNTDVGDTVTTIRDNTISAQNKTNTVNNTLTDTTTIYPTELFNNITEFTGDRRVKHTASNITDAFEFSDMPINNSSMLVSTTIESNTDVQSTAITTVTESANLSNSTSLIHNEYNATESKSDISDLDFTKDVINSTVNTDNSTELTLLPNLTSTIENIDYDRINSTELYLNTGNEVTDSTVDNIVQSNTDTITENRMQDVSTWNNSAEDTTVEVNMWNTSMQETSFTTEFIKENATFLNTITESSQDMENLTHEMSTVSDLLKISTVNNNTTDNLTDTDIHFDTSTFRNIVSNSGENTTWKVTDIPYTINTTTDLFKEISMEQTQTGSFETTAIITQTDATTTTVQDLTDANVTVSNSTEINETDLYSNTTELNINQINTLDKNDTEDCNNCTYDVVVKDTTVQSEISHNTTVSEESVTAIDNTTEMIQVPVTYDTTELSNSDATETVTENITNSPIAIYNGSDITVETDMNLNEANTTDNSLLNEIAITTDINTLMDNDTSGPTVYTDNNNITHLPEVQSYTPLQEGNTTDNFTFQDFEMVNSNLSDTTVNETENTDKVMLPEEWNNLSMNNCAEGKFACPGLTDCLDQSQQCDGMQDCPDRFDEIGCEEDCKLNFLCVNTSTCIKAAAKCDGIWDCESGSDEVECAPKECAPKEIMCADDSACIKLSDICNEIYNCRDRSDEVGCVERTTCDTNRFFCPEGLCIPLAQRCDGTTDCKNGEDETNCTCPANMFQCLNSVCISKDLVCDGKTDCLDGSDERFCVQVDFNGVVQVYDHHNMSWKLLCGDNWSIDDGNNLCQEFGFSQALSVNTMKVFQETEWMERNNFTASNSTLWTLGVQPTNSCISGMAATVQCQQFDCGKSHNQYRRKRIVGGQESGGHLPGQWTSLAIVYSNVSNKTCHAEIITPLWVLTSSQCLISRIPNADERMVRTGIIRSNVGENSIQERKVCNVIMHPHSSVHRSPILRDYDLALVRLEEPLIINNYINAICLPEEEVQPGITCFTGSFGSRQANEEPPSPPSLSHLAVVVYDRSECNEIEHYSSRVSARMICTTTTGATSLCNNDDGAPLMCLSTEKNWHVAGILSYQHNCGIYFKQPAVFSNVFAMKNFIEVIIGKNRYNISHDTSLYITDQPTTEITLVLNDTEDRSTQLITTESTINTEVTSFENLINTIPTVMAEEMNISTSVLTEYVQEMSTSTSTITFSIERDIATTNTSENDTNESLVLKPALDLHTNISEAYNDDDITTPIYLEEIKSENISFITTVPTLEEINATDKVENENGNESYKNINTTNNAINKLNESLISHLLENDAIQYDNENWTIGDPQTEITTENLMETSLITTPYDFPSTAYVSNTEKEIFPVSNMSEVPEINTVSNILLTEDKNINLSTSSNEPSHSAYVLQLNKSETLNENDVYLTHSNMNNVYMINTTETFSTKNDYTTLNTTLSTVTNGIANEEITTVDDTLVETTDQSLILNEAQENLTDISHNDTNKSLYTSISSVDNKFNKSQKNGTVEEEFNTLKSIPMQIVEQTENIFLDEKYNVITELPKGVIEETFTNYTDLLSIHKDNETTTENQLSSYLNDSFNISHNNTECGIEISHIGILKGITRCIATIISSQWIITSYKCLLNGNSSVNVSSLIFETTLFNSPIKNILTYPEFNSSHDSIALLELVNVHLTNSSSLCLTEHDNKPHECITAIWNNTLEDDNISYLPISVTLDEYCNSSYVTNQSSVNHICINHTNYFCQENGAPLMCINSGGLWQLRGISTKCENDNPSMTIYSSILSQFPWIKSKIGL